MRMVGSIFWVEHPTPMASRSEAREVAYSHDGHVGPNRIGVAVAPSDLTTTPTVGFNRTFESFQHFVQGF
jgi:hypothetical protein